MNGFGDLSFRTLRPPGPQNLTCFDDMHGQVCFDLFDTKKQEFLSADDLGEIMRAMGFRPTEEELTTLLAEIDEDGSGEIEIGEFCQLCATFLVEDPDMETMKRELKDAFRYVLKRTKEMRQNITFLSKQIV